MSHESWILGWDVGGAHLKVALADAGGRLHRCIVHYTPLWRGLDHLDRALDMLGETLPLERAAHRVTMTGELVDLFEDRAEGVARIAERMAGRLPPGRLGLYAGETGLVPPGEAAGHRDAIASANWHATARLVAQRLPAALLVDIGSTTTDLVPVAEGQVWARGRTDRERMAHDELVYTGVVRTPVIALASRVPVGGDWIGLAAEHFATSADVYRLTGELPAGADLGESADGRAKDQIHSAVRLARMIGDDAHRCEPKDWRRLARYLRECQIERIARACARQCSLGLPEDAPLVGAGVGRFLVRRLAERLERPYLDFSGLIDRVPAEAGGDPGVDPADCAPAAALAVLIVETADDADERRLAASETTT